MIGSIALIKHHLSRLVKDLRTVVRRLVRLTCAVVNEQVSPNDHEVIIHIGCTAVQSTTQTACAVDKIHMNAVECHDPSASVDAFQSHPFGWGLIGLLRVAIDGTGVDEQIVGRVCYAQRGRCTAVGVVIHDLVVAHAVRCGSEGGCWRGCVIRLTSQPSNERLCVSRRHGQRLGSAIAGGSEGCEVVGALYDVKRFLKSEKC